MIGKEIKNCLHSKNTFYNRTILYRLTLSLINYYLMIIRRIFRKDAFKLCFESKKKND